MILLTDLNGSRQSAAHSLGFTMLNSNDDCYLQDSILLNYDNGGISKGCRYLLCFKNSKGWLQDLHQFRGFFMPKGVTFSANLVYILRSASWIKFKS